MGCVTHVSTLSEIQIASKLSIARAKIYLETRYYIRDALSNLFDINPLKIPIIANPGKPPILPRGMGYISISHCKDAFLIGWHREKIGVDIERSDRDFNYKKLAQKYFDEKNIRYKNLNKYAILKKWSAIEAAIKCDKGKLSKDIKEWKYNEYKKTLFHRSKKIKLNLIQFNFLEWTITMTHQTRTRYHLPQIICCNL
tara:strand:- start:840 stop:1433 length:594 start_codon:yes stop_codon:yes gene_type:complete